MAKMPEKRRSEKKELKVISTNTRQDQISFKRSFFNEKIYFLGNKMELQFHQKYVGKNLMTNKKPFYVFCIAVHFYTLP
jgi:hypothetical protein